MIRALATLAALASACSYTATFHCESDADCATSGATCEGPGFCAFVDPSCTSQLRFGSLSGALANQCVGVIAIDAGTADTINCAADTDGDGVTDCIDNCPAIANPSQANEDLDRFGDACDPCPPIADDHPADSDGDGVADACDPNPTTPGDHIFRFEGFAGAVPADFTQNGAWTTANGTLDSMVGAVHNSVSFAGPTTGHETITAAFTLRNALIDGMGVGPIDEFTPGTDVGVECEVYSLSGNTPPAGVSLIETTPVVRMSVTAKPLPFDTLQTLTFRRDLTSYNCAVDVGGVDTTSPMASSNVTAASSFVGFRILNTTVEVSWILVVSSPG